MLKFVKYGLWFFIPIIIVFILLEMMVVNIPTNFSIIGDHLENNQQTIEVASFGSSQVKNAINPVYIDKETINLASTMQHHNTDFKLLTQTRDRLSNLKVVVFEVSYSHFELGHNSKYYWKSNVFLKYYDVKLLDRVSFPSDSLLFISHPGYFSKLLVDTYIRKTSSIQYNKYGYNENRYKGKFKKLKYDTTAISNNFVKINLRANTKIFNFNVAFFYKMLDYCQQENLQVIIISPPTHYNYNKLRNPFILKRRDRVLTEISEKYDNISFLIAEEDPEFTARKFWNENHLNPDGAKIFSKKLNKIINQLD